MLTATPGPSLHTEHRARHLVFWELGRSPKSMNTQIPQDLPVRRANSMPGEFEAGREHQELTGKASQVTFRQMEKTASQAGRPSLEKAQKWERNCCFCYSFSSRLGDSSGEGDGIAGRDCHLHLERSSTLCSIRGWQTQAVFVNVVFMNSHSQSFTMVCGCSPTTAAELIM